MVTCGRRAAIGTDPPPVVRAITVGSWPGDQLSPRWAACEAAARGGAQLASSKPGCQPACCDLAGGPPERLVGCFRGVARPAARRADSGPVSRRQESAQDRTVGRGEDARRPRARRSARRPRPPAGRRAHPACMGRRSRRRPRTDRPSRALGMRRRPRRTRAHRWERPAVGSRQPREVHDVVAGQLDAREDLHRRGTGHGRAYAREQLDAGASSAARASSAAGAPNALNGSSSGVTSVSCSAWRAPRPSAPAHRPAGSTRSPAARRSRCARPCRRAGRRRRRRKRRHGPRTKQTPCS